MPDLPEVLVVGRVERPHGLSGEVSASVWTDFPERFAPGAVVVWKRGSEERSLTLSGVRPHGKRLLLAFQGVDSVEDARPLSGGDLCVTAAEAFPAPAGFFYDHEIRGWTCEDARGRRLGEAAGLEATPAGPLLSVETRPGQVALVPFVNGIVIEVDRNRRRIVLDPPEGLLDLAESRPSKADR
jgi:16S rRNA processing protein RimM